MTDTQSVLLLLTFGLVTHNFLCCEKRSEINFKPFSSDMNGHNPQAEFGGRLSSFDSFPRRSFLTQASERGEVPAFSEVPPFNALSTEALQKVCVRERQPLEREEERQETKQMLHFAAHLHRPAADNMMQPAKERKENSTLNAF